MRPTGTGLYGERVTDQLAVLEGYYDAAPRPHAHTEEVGPFTLFLRDDPAWWPYYGRPRLGLTEAVTADDVRALLARQDEVEVPQTIEWVHETTPSLLVAARAAGLAVEECPLLALSEPDLLEPPEGIALELMAADSHHLGEIDAAVGGAFSGTDDVGPGDGTRSAQAIERGLASVVGAFEVHDHGLGAAVGGGTHNPRGAVTEIVGIGVLPRARRRGIGAAVASALAADAARLGIGTVFLSAQDDAVARVYERVGFRRVGTACIVG